LPPVVAERATVNESHGLARIHAVASQFAKTIDQALATRVVGFRNDLSLTVPKKVGKLKSSADKASKLYLNFRKFF
jgi:hypothetical protein